MGWGGGGQLWAHFLPSPPFLQTSDPQLTSNVFLDTQQTQHATLDIKHQTLCTYLSRTSPTLVKQNEPADDTIADEFLKYYKTPHGIQFDIDQLVINKQKKFGQIRKYRQRRVEKVKRSCRILPIIVTAWESPSILLVCSPITFRKWVGFPRFGDS